MSLRQCLNDIDCYPKQYCYVSKFCANFTDCIAYNREINRALDSNLQCGECKNGYVAEILANGEANLLCHTITISDTQEYMTNLFIIISIIIICIILTALSYLKCNWMKYHLSRICTYFTQRNATRTDIVITSNKTNLNESTTNDDHHSLAPLEEQNSLIEVAQEKSVFNNNRSTVNNEYQTSVVCSPPLRYVSDTAPYELVIRRAAPNEGNIVIPLQNDIPNNLSTMQLRIVQPEINIEQEDNARNTTLLQTHSSDSDSNSSPESTRKNNTTKDNVIVNQALNQNITMNLNVNTK